MRFKILSLLLMIGTFLNFPARAQDTVCNPDLAQVTALLAEAQAAIESGDTAGTVSLMADARNMLTLQEAGCVNYAPETSGDKRSNPVPFGERKSFKLSGGGQASLEIVNFIDDANDFSRSEIEDGKRLVAVELMYFCELIPDEQCAVAEYSFNLVGSASIEYSPHFENSLPDSTSFDLYGGGQGPFTVGFLVGEDETNFVLRRSSLDPMVPHTYFATS
jgi:hypothetical protein